jgi:predicted nucleic acid-binding protein
MCPGDRRGGTTALVIAETAYLIRRQLGAAAEAGFFRALAASELQVEVITPADARRIAELIERYTDLGLGGTDASLIVVAERLGVTRIATLDRRHFGVVRPSHTGSAFDRPRSSRQRMIRTSSPSPGSSPAQALSAVTTGT